MMPNFNQLPMLMNDPNMMLALPQFPGMNMNQAFGGNFNFPEFK